MKRPTFLAGAAFGPEALKVIAEAFDQAWKEIATEVGGQPTYLPTRSSIVRPPLQCMSQELTLSHRSERSLDWSAIGSRSTVPSRWHDTA